MKRFYSSIIRSRSDTIYALASGAQAAAINVIRVSGDQVEQVMRCLTTDADRLLQNPNLLRRVVLTDEIDEAMLVYFKGPRSFTGEDVLEIHSHGSMAIRKALFSKLSAIAGVRPAEAGEFSQRAFLNGKMGLTEAEALRDLIHAQGELQRKQAFQAYQGRTAKQLSQWRQQLIQALAILEAWIDFGEDEQIESDALLQVQQTMQSMQSTMQQRLEQDKDAEIVREGLRIAIGGLPNAGKSSLLNALLGHKAAIVSDLPGTTRDPIERSLEVAGMLVHLTDTAGIRTATDAIEAEGVQMAMDHLQEAHLILLVVDARELMQKSCALPEVDPSKTMVLLNKIDLLDHTPSVWPLPAQLQQCPIWPLSLKQASRPALISGLSRLIEQRYAKLISDPPILAHARHQSSIQNAILALSHSIALLPTDPVGAAEYLRRAAAEVGRVTGHIGADEVLDVLFSSFCIGK